MIYQIPVDQITGLAKYGLALSCSAVSDLAESDLARYAPPLLDGCCLFTKRGPEFCPNAGYSDFIGNDSLEGILLVVVCQHCQPIRFVLISSAIAILDHFPIRGRLLAPLARLAPIILTTNSSSAK